MSEHDRDLVAALRTGDESAFAILVDRYHPTMIRVAGAYVRDAAVAEEVAQETWLGVLKGLEKFEERASLKTWIFSILVNRAKTKAQVERRSVPFSSLAEDAAEPGEPAVAPDRFMPGDHPKWPRWWDSYPTDWDRIPEERLLAKETRNVVERAIEDLPLGQRLVITLRDVEGLSAEETCSVLGVTQTNQRVLLHRARSRVRRALERYLDEETT